MAKRSGNDFDDLRAKIAIDRDDLDTNAMEQPDLYYQVSEQVVLAQSRRDETNMALERKIAEIDSEVREDHASDDKKPTEKAISNEVEGHKAIQLLREELQSRIAEMAKWNALKGAFDQRASMLKVAATLYSSNYFTRSGVAGAKNQMENKDAEEVRERGGQERRKRMKE